MIFKRIHILMNPVVKLELTILSTCSDDLNKCHLAPHITISEKEKHPMNQWMHYIGLTSFISLIILSLYNLLSFQKNLDTDLLMLFYLSKFQSYFISFTDFLSTSAVSCIRLLKLRTKLCGFSIPWNPNQMPGGTVIRA